MKDIKQELEEEDLDEVDFRKDVVELKKIARKERQHDFGHYRPQVIDA